MKGLGSCGTRVLKATARTWKQLTVLVNNCLYPTELPSAQHPLACAFSSSPAHNLPSPVRSPPPLTILRKTAAAFFSLKLPATSKGACQGGMERQGEPACSGPMLITTCRGLSSGSSRTPPSCAEDKAPTQDWITQLSFLSALGHTFPAPDTVV